MFIIQNETKIYLTIGNNSEILEHNGGSDLIRITYSHSPGGGTYMTICSHINQCRRPANVLLSNIL